MRILVIDNDASPTAKEAIEEFRARTTVETEYRHAPGGNISIARNAALKGTPTRWLAFLDDDEYASTDWLANLVRFREGVTAVFGPCEAIYADSAPSWVKIGDYHSNRISDRKRPIDTGYTSNVLIDMDFVRRHALAFDPALGRTGGEDTMFFHAIYSKGGALRYAADAVAYEEVVKSRLNIGWVWRRRYRAGQVYAMMFRRFDRSAYRRIAWTAAPKILACLIMAGATIYAPAHALWWLMRGTFHCGVLSYGLGASVLQEYRDGP
jgi:succinoglycan biosynthesis protein ExoM